MKYNEWGDMLLICIGFHRLSHHSFDFSWFLIGFSCFSHFSHFPLAWPALMGNISGSTVGPGWSGYVDINWT